MEKNHYYATVGRNGQNHDHTADALWFLWIDTAVYVEIGMMLIHVYGAQCNDMIFMPIGGLSSGARDKDYLYILLGSILGCVGERHFYNAWSDESTLIRLCVQSNKRFNILNLT